MVDELVLVLIQRGRWINLVMNNSSSFLGWLGMVARKPDLLVACVTLIALHPANILGLTRLSIISRISNLHICWHQSINQTQIRLKVLTCQQKVSNHKRTPSPANKPKIAGFHDWNSFIVERRHFYIQSSSSAAYGSLLDSLLCSTVTVHMSECCKPQVKSHKWEHR